MKPAARWPSKLIRIYFACWKSKTEYREDAYLAALKKNGSLIAAELVTTGE